MAITLLDMLLNAGLITRDQFEDALQNRVLYGGKIGTSLIELGFVSEVVLARFLSSKLSVPYVPPRMLLSIPDDVISLIPREIAVKYRVIPISFEKKRLNLAMADPADLNALGEIGFITGFVIRPLITPEVRLVQALGRYYHEEMDPRYQQIIQMIEARRQEEEARQAQILELSDEDILPGELPVSVAEAEDELEEIELVEEVAPREWPNHVRRLEPDEVSRGLAYAESGDEIADLLMVRLGNILQRVALFRIKDGKAIGWKGISRKAPIKGVTQLSLPLSEPSVLRTATESAGFFIGPLPDTPVNHFLHDALGGGEPQPVLLMPLFVGSRIVNILYAEDAGDLGAMVPEMQKLLTKAALAFELLIFREKILML